VSYPVSSGAVPFEVAFKKSIRFTKRSEVDIGKQSRSALPLPVDCLFRFIGFVDYESGISSGDHFPPDKLAISRVLTGAVPIDVAKFCQSERVAEIPTGVAEVLEPATHDIPVCLLLRRKRPKTDRRSKG
jgi:hypothetical protein